MTVYEYIEANPDSTSGDIARGMGKGTSSIAGTISQLYTTGRIIKSGVKNEIVTWRINDMPYGCSNALLSQFNQLLRRVRQ